jgi:hypothetical protein
MHFRVAVGCALVVLVAVTGCGRRTVVSVTGSKGPVSAPVSSPAVTPAPRWDTPDASPSPPESSFAPSTTAVAVHRVPLESGGYLFVVTEGVYGPLTVALHDVIDVQLVSDAYGQDGRVVPWQTPTSSDPAVLTPDHPAGMPPCPERATCTAFTASTRGVVTLLIGGPAGLLCDDTGANCGAVAPIGYGITITVAPAAAAQLTPSGSSPASDPATLTPTLVPSLPTGSTACGNAMISATTPAGTQPLLDCAAMAYGTPVIRVHIGDQIMLSGLDDRTLVTTSPAAVVDVHGSLLIARQLGAARIIVHGWSCVPANGTQPTSCPLAQIAVS